MCGNFNAGFILSLLFVLSCLTPGLAIKCYKCSMTTPSAYSKEEPRLCSNFNYSEKYIVDCPYSTLCMKKHFSVYLTVPPVNGTMRDCAKQRYDYQDFKNGKWQMEMAIEEPYEEGCARSDDEGLRNSQTEYCYCRGDLCNAADVPKQSFLSVIPILLYTFKYAFRILL